MLASVVREGGGDDEAGRWEEDRDGVISSLTPTPVAFPYHPASLESLILVTDEFEVWACPGRWRDRAM